MSQIIEIQTAPWLDTERMLAALSAQGVRGALIAEVPALRLLVSAPALRQLPARVLSALETVSSGLVPLVPEQIDEGTYAVRPPAG
jgi:hypothetical protein